MPRALPRLLRVPTEDGTIQYVFLQDIISTYAAKLYRGYDILAHASFRVTRNSNLYLEEEETRNLLEMSTRRSPSAAKAKPCAWKSKKARIQKSSSAWSPRLSSTNRWFFAYAAR